MNLENCSFNRLITKGLLVAGLLGLLKVELCAQPFVVDTTFKPFFKVEDSGFPGFLNSVWENPNTGVIFTVGGQGLYTSTNSGAANPSYLQPLGGGDIFNFFPINDSTFVRVSTGSYALIDSSGAVVRIDWLNNHRNTASCAFGVYPFFFDNGSSLMANLAPGNPNGPGVNCRIVNPPDTFAHRFIVKVDSLGNWDSSFVKDASGIPQGFAAYDSSRTWVFGFPRDLTNYDGIAVDGLCRVYSDGTLDSTFTSPLLPSTTSFFYPTEIEADGGFFLRGYFQLKEDSNKYRTLVRFNGNGTIDSSFSVEAATDSVGGPAIVSSIVSVDNGGYLVGGAFNQYQGHPANAIVKIDSNGILQPQYFTGAGPDSSSRFFSGFPDEPHSVGQIVPSVFGGFYVVGDFTRWDGVRTQPIVRLRDFKTVGIKEIQQPIEIKVFPNPANEIVSVNSNMITNKDAITLHDLLGRRQHVKVIAVHSNSYQLDVSQITPGIYVLSVEYSNGRVWSNKIVKK